MSSSSSSSPVSDPLKKTEEPPRPRYSMSQLDSTISSTSTRVSETERLAVGVANEQEKKSFIHFSDDLPAPGPMSLRPTTAVCVAAIFEELSDRLEALSLSLGGCPVELRTKMSIEFDKWFHRPLVDFKKRSAKEQSLSENVRWLMKQQYGTILTRRIGQMGRSMPETKRLSLALREAHLQRQTVKGKTQMDRRFLQYVANQTLTELVQKNSFHVLVESAQRERERHQHMVDSITQYWKDKDHIKQLRADIKTARRDKMQAAQCMQLGLWDLEDDMQELGARCQQEMNYVARIARMMKGRSIKLCLKEGDAVEKTLSDMKVAYENEFRCHNSMVKIIQLRIEKASALLENWLEKHEIDKERVQAQLDGLKDDRKECLDRIAYLNRMINEYMPIVLDDRRIKKIARDRRKTTYIQNKRAIKIQAWWRGTMVRKALGPFSAEGRKKAGKGKKKGGKKGKKK